MRVARVLLFLALSGAVAHADDAKPADPHPADASPARAKVPLRVVRMLPETKQALLFDKTKGTHVVVETGQAVEGFLVDSIDDDEVTLLSDNGTTVVLAAPDWHHRREADRASETSHAAPAKAAAAEKADGPQPADPYADIAPTSELGTGADGVRVVEAPDAPTVTSAPVATPAPVAATAPAPVAVTAPAPVAAAPTPAPAAAPSDPAGDALAALTGVVAPTTAAPAASGGTTAAADGPVVLARADVNAALASFSTLAGGIHAAFTPTGVRVDGVAAGSLFAKAGLRAGDLVSAVNGVPLRSLDDAADLYARAGTAKAVSVAVTRAGKPIVLRVTIQ